jgi:hypothetical protein
MVPSAVTSPSTPWLVVAKHLEISIDVVKVLSASDILPVSPYRQRFRDGAILYPRMLLFVDEQPAGPLGSGAGRVVVQSRRSSAEKKPWKDLPPLKGTVEIGFVRPVHLGETLLPFRVLPPLRAVLPVTAKGIMSRSDIEEQEGLSKWWLQAEEQLVGPQRRGRHD